MVQPFDAKSFRLSGEPMPLSSRQPKSNERLRGFVRSGICCERMKAMAFLEHGIGSLGYAGPVSPTILRVKGFRFYFFSREERRAHVHVQHADGEAKF